MTKQNKHAWLLSDLETVPKNGLKVMSTFSCGGGSTMGYKLAGCDVIAANDIDPVMKKNYELNFNPNYFFNCPIKDLVNKKLPDELFNLDILDGSPPCSSFSMAGNRSKDWGKEKKFREGQSVQILDDLFFDFIALADRLKPKVIIAENVKGMVSGIAKGYVKEVSKRIQKAGYRVQLFLINSADCGVPQKRERVFFCCVRNDVSSAKLSLKPSAKWINIKDAISDIRISGKELEGLKIKSRKTMWLYKKTKHGAGFSNAYNSLEKKAGYWSARRTCPRKPSPTLVSGCIDLLYHWRDPRKFSFRELARLGSFPDDYKPTSNSIGAYMIGMSVPPKMTKVVAESIISQWLEG